MQDRQGAAQKELARQNQSFLDKQTHLLENLQDGNAHDGGKSKGGKGKKRGKVWLSEVREHKHHKGGKGGGHNNQKWHTGNTWNNNKWNAGGS